MTGLILKLSYNQTGETPLTGGICGSFFFIKSNLVVTANHVLNKKSFKPNDGFRYSQFWLIVQQKIIIELSRDDLIDFPEIDTTIINLHNKYDVNVRRLSTSPIQIGQSCYNEGFIGGQMPGVNATWGSDSLIITSCNYNNTEVVGDGYVKSKKRMTVSAADINMENVNGVETSYGGTVGMSGGPLINKDTNEIFGLMSIGLPADNQIKKSLFAISTDEIKKKIQP